MSDLWPVTSKEVHYASSILLPCKEIDAKMLTVSRRDEKHTPLLGDCSEAQRQAVAETYLSGLQEVDLFGPRLLFLQRQNGRMGVS